MGSNLCDNIASCDNLVSASNELDDIDEEENYMSLEEQRSDSNKDPTQPPHEDDAGEGHDDEIPPESKDNENKKKGGGVDEGGAGGQEKGEKLATVTTGATSGAANIIKNNLDNTITVGAPSHSDNDPGCDHQSVRAAVSAPVPVPAASVPQSSSAQKIIPPAIVNHPPAFHLDHNTNYVMGLSDSTSQSVQITNGNHHETPVIILTGCSPLPSTLAPDFPNSQQLLSPATAVTTANNINNNQQQKCVE